MQVPIAPSSAQARQTSVQAVLQQTPSAQNPLSHSVATTQDVPSGWPRVPPPSLPGESWATSPAPPSGGLSFAPSLVGVSFDASLPLLFPAAPVHDTTSSPSAQTDTVRTIRMPPHGS
jgi:hypothetical protein